ncbi:MAG: hypothetical protein ACKESB_01085, partial [Candidatus Hodgkinia cicadicola]
MPIECFNCALSLKQLVGRPSCRSFEQVLRSVLECYSTRLWACGDGREKGGDGGEKREWGEEGKQSRNHYSDKSYSPIINSIISSLIAAVLAAIIL